jgi:hypothetical protein
MLTFVFAVLFSSACASAGSWSEVTRFTGAGTANYATDYFNCNHAEWRIVWSYTPDQAYPNLTIFNVYAYPQGENALFVASIFQTGATVTSGTTYVHNNEGTFYLKINVANTQNYTVTVEQDIDSVPEYPNIIIPTIAALSILTIFLGFKIKRNVKAQKSLCPH